MSEATSPKTRLEEMSDALLGPGRCLFSLAIIALGIEIFVCARDAALSSLSTMESSRRSPGYPQFPGFDTCSA
jgi:hypothetical protein